jgi:hypothetical protein
MFLASESRWTALPRPALVMLRAGSRPARSKEMNRFLSGLTPILARMQGMTVQIGGQ